MRLISTVRARDTPPLKSSIDSAIPWPYARHVLPRRLGELARRDEHAASFLNALLGRGLVGGGQFLGVIGIRHLGTRACTAARTPFAG